MIEFPDHAYVIQDRYDKLFAKGAVRDVAAYNYSAGSSGQGTSFSCDAGQGRDVFQPE
ncbi:hypothetical protein ACHAPJ_008494 [Fusarium lateritium]